MNFYVTTSIPYVNDEPHIGHALELIQADVIARHARLNGNQVIFSTGTDEHGGKIAEKAAEHKLKPKEFADNVSAKFRELCALLNISNDRFIRTTDAGHEQRAQIIWKNLSADIYKGKYIGWYCTGDEAFFTDAVVRANKGICPAHNRKYEKVEEENYFFKLSKYTQEIQHAVESGSLRIIPASKKHEILQVINEGLEDISISRPKDKIDWGIPVPGDKTQVMYVWFEALMNYLTVLGYPEHQDFKKFWPANYQVIGKDILRFHAAIWPGILLGLSLPLPKTLYVHGFITLDNKKISKSLKNVISPKEVIDKYGVDALRYYLLRHIPSYEDGDFSWQKLHDSYNNELANELGNAVQRTAAMIIQYQNGIIGEIPESQHDTADYGEALDNCRFDRALDDVWEQIRGLNQYIEEEKPWALSKEGDADHLREVLAYQACCLLEIADLLQPFLPNTATQIRNVFEEGVVRPIKGTLFPRKDITKKAKAKKA
ncbi:MAG TPA: methionine--tRNA ligase [Candidatus Saccharimonadales bacterium]|nr:methionine--tRNA ligase [Candidatus Saccharimonadales bacterium]